MIIIVTITISLTMTMTNELKLSHFRTFAAVIACKSFSAAGLKLGLTQPAVSLQMRRLEKSLGVRLIERIGKRALPTPAGRHFLEFARRIADQTDEAIRQLREYGEGRSGYIRIGVGATACTYLLPSVLASLGKAHPKLKVKLITGNTPEMLDRVEENALDLALVTLPAVRRKLVVRELLEDPLVAIFPSGQKISSQSIRPQSISRESLILYESGGMIRGLIDRWFSFSGVDFEAAMEVGSVEATKKFVALGLGCSIVPAMAVKNNDRCGLFVCPLSPKLSRRLGLVLRHDKILDKMMRSTIKSFENALQ